MQREFYQESVSAAFALGHVEGFDFLYTHFSESLYFFMFDLCRNKEQAEDLTADAFTKLWSRLDNIEDYSNVKGYLFTTAYNGFIDSLKCKKRKEKRYQAAICLFDDSNEQTVLDSLTRTEFMQEIYQAIELLPPQCQKIMKLAFVEGLKNKAISDAMQLSIHTVKWHKQKGIELLRKLLRLSIFLILFLSDLFFF